MWSVMVLPKVITLSGVYYNHVLQKLNYSGDFFYKVYVVLKKFNSLTLKFKVWLGDDQSKKLYVKMTQFNN